MSQETQRNRWFPAADFFMQPGDRFTYSSTYRPTAADIGTVTCELVILDLAGGPMHLGVDARVTAIAPVKITVRPK